MGAACYNDGNVRVCTTQQQPEKQVMAELRVYASVDEVGCPAVVQPSCEAPGANPLWAYPQ